VRLGGDLGKMVRDAARTIDYHCAVAGGNNLPDARVN
jgi:phosphoribosylaminoimidazole carboxylase (NCAIR synthetase)